MAREQRSESLDSIVTDDSEDPLTCPLTQRLFHDPVILVASGKDAVHQSNRRAAAPPRLKHGLHAIDATPARWRGGVVYDRSTPNSPIDLRTGVTYEASALEECLRRAPDMDPKTGERFELPAVTAPNLVARSLAARRRKSLRL